MGEAFNSSPYKKDIHFIGRVTDKELIDLIGASYALMYASKFEGFGIPIVEAMKCGVPVITSNETAMPEIAGDAALLVNPHSVDSMSDAMIKLVSDDVLRQALISKGFEQSKKFSWDQSAEKMWKSVELAVKK
jgi:glycosyltransferase involved in cell wall biosynthesis